MKNKGYINNSTQRYTPPKKAQKKDWTYWVVVIALAFTFLGSILGTVAFVKTCAADNSTLANISSSDDVLNYKADNNFISAYDTSSEQVFYSFQSSNLFIPAVNEQSNVYTTTNRVLQFQYDIVRNDSNNYTFQFSCYNGLVETSLYGFQGVKMPGMKVISFTNSYPYTYTYDKSNTTNNYEVFSLSCGASNTVVRNRVGIRLNYYDNSSDYQLLSAPFDKLVVGYEFPNWDDNYATFLFNEPTENISNYYLNYLRYYQQDYLAIEVAFLVYSADVRFSLLNERTYYLNNNQVILEDYQQGYDNGVIVGTQQGIDQGKQIGYQDGYADGVNDGYNTGFNEGTEDAGNYTFLKLFGALFDAPIQAISGLLNFDLLGFNMLNFFYAILTIAIIVFIVRLVL